MNKDNKHFGYPSDFTVKTGGQKDCQCGKPGYCEDAHLSGVEGIAPDFPSIDEIREGPYIDYSKVGYGTAETLFEVDTADKDSGKLVRSPDDIKEIEYLKQLNENQKHTIEGQREEMSSLLNEVRHLETALSKLVDAGATARISKLEEPLAKQRKMIDHLKNECDMLQTQRDEMHDDQQKWINATLKAQKAAKKWKRKHDKLASRFVEGWQGWTDKSADCHTVLAAAENEINALRLRIDGKTEWVIDQAGYDALPDGSIVTMDGGVPCWKTNNGRWRTGGGGPFHSDQPRQVLRHGWGDK